MGSGKTTILNLDSDDRLGRPRGEAMLHAVREAAAGVYELLGELGRSRYGSIVYLARELATGGLTALKLNVSPTNSNELELTLATELDESIPAHGFACHFCGENLDSWGRFCTACGRDVSGVVTDRMSAIEREDLLAAARSASAGEYEILGEMQRVRGGGIVYFARELASNQIIALRLQQDPKANERGETEYSLGKTQVLKPLLDGPDDDDAADEPASAAVDPHAAPTLRPPNDRNVPEVATGDVTPRTPTPSEPPSLVADPPPSRVRGPVRIGTRHLVIGGAALALVLAVVAIAVSTGDDPASTPPIAVDTRQQQPPPPPQPQPQPPPPIVPDSAELVLLRLPRGARVTIDGIARRDTIVKLSVGKHLVEATAPGFSRSRQQIELGPGQTKRGLRFVVSPDTTKRVGAGTQETARQPQAPPKPTCQATVAAAEWQSARQLCDTEGRAGDAYAERQMGLMYLGGLGGTRDEGQAVVWLQRSADRGVRDSQYDLARVFQTSSTRRNDRRAFDLFTLAATHGHREAQFQLGRMNEKGIGTDKNAAQAFHWFQLAADQGHAEAQAGIGVFYLKAYGTARNDTKALEWLRKGANGGSSSAMYYLGVFYEEGRAGLPKSRAEAKTWYRKSADLGNPEAKKALARN